ncbi:MAG: hypothetical protein WBF71_02500 [Microthrixaceae bacterium]
MAGETPGRGRMRRIRTFSNGLYETAGTDPARVILWISSAAIATAGLIAVIGSYRSGWFPIGDSAVVAGRAEMLGRGDIPLLGMPTSFWSFTGVMSYHPGPLLFFWMAPWVFVFGMSFGSMLGAGALNVLAILVSGWAVRRVADARRALVFVLAGAFLLTLVAPRGLMRPLNSILSAMPLFAVLVLAWAVLCGSRAALPVLVAMASFVAQAHVAYTLVAIGVAVPVAIFGTWTNRGDRGNGGRRRWFSIAGPIGLLVLLWIGPIIDAVANGGGNLAELWRAAISGDIPSRGPAAAGRFLMGLLWLLPGKRTEQLVFDGPIQWWGLLLVLPVGAVLVASFRSGSKVERMSVLVLGLGIAVGCVTAALLPVTQINPLQGYWYQVLAVYFWCVVAACGLELLQRFTLARWLGYPAFVVYLVLLVNVIGIVARPPGMTSEHSETFFRHFIDDVGEKVALAVPTRDRYLIEANRSVDADRVLQNFIADRITRSLPVAIEATSYWGDDYGLWVGPQIDGIVLITDRAISNLASYGTDAPAQEIGSEKGPLGDQRSRTAESLEEFVSENGPLELTEVGRLRLAEALDGRLPGECEDLDDYRERPNLIVQRAPEALLQLYKEGWVDSPNLSPELQEQIFSAHRPGLWVYSLDIDHVDLVGRNPEKLVLNRLGCAR